MLKIYVAKIAIIAKSKIDCQSNVSTLNGGVLYAIGASTLLSHNIFFICDLKC